MDYLGGSIVNIDISKVCMFKCMNCKNLNIYGRQQWKICQKAEAEIKKKSDGKVYCSEYLKKEEDSYVSCQRCFLPI